MGVLGDAGVLRQALCIKESDRFSLRKGIKTTNLEIRRSMLMNLLISSYRCVRVIRATSLFALSVTAALENLKKQQDKRRVVALKVNRQLDDAVLPYLEARQKSQRQNNELKSVNAFLKPCLEPHVAHHTKKEGRASIS